MLFCDVAGPPGVGKSTLTDKLWPPRCIQWDMQPYPDEWADFLAITDGLLKQIADHPSIGACKSMIQRSFRKIATVSRMQDERVYIQTGLVQRGLGIGWRLKDPEKVAAYFEAMPVSAGVAILFADVETVQRRNVERGKDRSYMVPLMERPREIAVEVLRARDVPLIELDTTRPVSENIRDLLAFADRSARAADTGAAGHCGQVAVPAAPA